MNRPDISVVMSVYNGADQLQETLQSVLSQEGCSFEFIVIDDGSIDRTATLLDECAARDSRLVVIHQPNTGLTRALIKGCEVARGEYIARQDCGDLSLPGRLAIQLNLLRAGGNYVAASCYTKFIGPKGESLHVSRIGESNLNAALVSGLERRLKGPSHHGSVMFARNAYIRVGGYREQFLLAQDLDLWTRLVEHGAFGVVHDEFYVARLHPGSISGTQSREQRMLSGLIAEASEARRRGASEASILAAAKMVRPIRSDQLARRTAHGNYFIGSCLRLRDPQAALPYFEAATAGDPLLFRAWVRMLQIRFGTWCGY